MAILDKNFMFCGFSSFLLKISSSFFFVVVVLLLLLLGNEDYKVTKWMVVILGWCSISLGRNFILILMVSRRSHLFKSDQHLREGKLQLFSLITLNFELMLIEQGCALRQLYS